jgi:exodeoxyribonuclease VII small subunit
VVSDTPKNNDFASTLGDLEKIVAELDSDIPIERALELFEQGMQLSAGLEKFLGAAEQKVEILRRTAAGSLSTDPLKSELLDTTGS